MGYRARATTVRVVLKAPGRRDARRMTAEACGRGGQEGQAAPREEDQVTLGPNRRLVGVAESKACVVFGECSRCGP